jgi:hypothetical protein
MSPIYWQNSMQKHTHTPLAAASIAVVSVVLAVLPTAAHAAADSPWLPIPGQASLSLNHTQQTANDAYVGSTQLPISGITGGAASKYERSATRLRVGYGLFDAVSLDATLGVGKVKVGAADNDSGSLDTIVGVNWRVLDEYEQGGAPTITLRGAAIVKGSYDGAKLAALGNAQNGVEVALIIGKEVLPGLALWGEVGVLDHSGAVPNATTVELGARYRFGGGFSASLGFAQEKYGGNLDIGGPGFSPARFQEVRAERSLTKLGLGYAFAGNQGLALSFASTGKGRNTVKDKQIIGLGYTVGF